MSLPAGGVVTLLFTDLVGSTEALDHLGEEAAEELRQAHFSLLRRAVAETGGREVKNLGDGLMVAFSSPTQAVAGAIAVQRAVAEHNRARPHLGLSVRVGLHAGEPVHDEEDFFGKAVVVARRLCDAAQGGQILASDVVGGLVGTRGGFRFRPHGRLRLKGLADPLGTVLVDWDRPESPAREARAPRRSSGPAPRGPRLVGRDDELAILEDELARAADGEFRCVLLLGDSGVGKTRLAGELVARHGDIDLALTARAYPFGQTVSFGVWSEALERHLRELAPYEVVDACGGFLDDLAALLRSVAAARGSAPEREPPRFRLLDGLAVLLANLARDGPVVVLLDDMHLADASSWDALHYLAHSLGGSPVLVLLAARAAELAEQPSAAAVIQGLTQDGQLRRLALGPVTRPALAELCQAVLHVPPPGVLVEWLDERSRGNPLFALGLLQALVEEGADLAAPRLRRFPETLSERVAGRLQVLDDDALATVEVLAVFARPVEMADLGRLTGLAPDRLADTLHRLIRSRFVVAEERDGDPGYELAHPILQEVIYERVGLPRQRALHRLAGRALLAAGRPGEAAPHFARSAHMGDAEAIAALREALQQAEDRQAYLEGLEILTTLVELLPHDDQRWPEVVDAVSSQAEWVFDHRFEVEAERAIAAMRAVDSVLERSPDLGRRGTIKYRLSSFLAVGMGEVEAAAPLCQAAISLFTEAGDQTSALMARGELAYLHSLRGDWVAMEEEIEHVLEHAEAAGELFAAVQALAARARSAFHRGLFSEGHLAVERMEALAEARGNRDHITYSLIMRAVLLMFEGRIIEGRPVVAEARSTSPSYWESILPPWEIAFCWFAGEFEAALATAEAVVHHSPKGISRRRAIGLLFGALAAMEADQTAKAQAYLARVRAIYGVRGWFFYSSSVDHVAAVVAAREGRSTEAVAGLQQAAETILRWEARPWAALALIDLCEVVADAGEVDRHSVSEEAASRLEDIAADTDRDLYRALAAAARGWAELAHGRHDAAAKLAEQAAATFSALGYQGFAGRALDLLGRARARHDRREALRAFQEANSTFDACGAVWRRERTRAAMRALGTSGRKAAVARLGPEALTRRERDVARLAVEGHTARQIAKQLFIGERTVEGHLASVYVKLGIGSRADLVRRRQQLGL